MGPLLIRFKLLLFILSVSVIPAKAAGFRFVLIGACEGFLEHKLASSRPIYDESVRAFLTSSNLLYSYSDFDDPYVEEWYASNETDFFRAPMDDQKVDVLYGFGTNNTWDLAIRMNVSSLVIGDINWAPLVAQEYILKPLLLISKNRFEFLSMLSGFAPTSDLDDHSSLDEIFEAVERSTASFSEQKTFAVEIITRVSKDPRLGVSYVPLLAKYLAGRLAMLHLIDFTSKRYEDDLKKVSPFPGGNSSQAVQLYEYFRMRYKPSVLIKKGASPSQLATKWFSFLSSEESFLKLVNLFDGHVKYVHADFRDFNAFERILQNSGKQNPTIAISTTNIIDARFLPEESKSEWQQFTASSSEKLFGLGVRGPIPFYRTRGVGSKHGFDRVILDHQ